MTSLRMGCTMSLVQLPNCSQLLSNASHSAAIPTAVLARGWGRGALANACGSGHTQDWGYLPFYPSQPLAFECSYCALHSTRGEEGMRAKWESKLSELSTMDKYLEKAWGTQCR